MSQPPGESCHCANSYNVRKIRISDGRTVWRRLITYDVVTNEVQRLVQTGTRTGGTFRLTYSGQTTEQIPDGSTAATIASSLEALSTIGAGNVTCSGGPLANGVSVYITFIGDLAGQNLPLITLTDHGGQYALVASTNGSTVVLNRANDCAHVAGCRDEANRLVVGIGTSSFIAHGVSTANGSLVWNMPEDVLANPELDSNTSGQWSGVFSRDVPDTRTADDILGGVYYYTPVGLMAVADVTNTRQWSLLLSRPPGRCFAKFGDGTYYVSEAGLASALSVDGGRVTYGNASNGNQSYRVVNSHGLPNTRVITNVFGVHDEIAIVEITWFGIGEETYSVETRMWDLRANTHAIIDGVLSPANTFESNVTDARWQRREGTPEVFFCLTNNIGIYLFNVLTGAYDSLDEPGLLRISPKPTWGLPGGGRMLPTGTQPQKLWLCSDGVVVICGSSSFTINGQTCEIFKCDFDLNLLWTRRWRGVGAGNALRGISGDDKHVYVSGDVGSWVQSDDL